MSTGSRSGKLNDLGHKRRPAINRAVLRRVLADPRLIPPSPFPHKIVNKIHHLGHEISIAAVSRAPERY